MTIRNVRDFDNVAKFLEDFSISGEFFEKLKTSANYQPDLSFVLENANEIVGLMLFSKIKLGKEKALYLDPILISPNFQHKGLGKHLFKRGIEAVKSTNYEYILAPKCTFLESFGFKPAENFGVICEKELSLLSFIGDEKLDCELKLPRYFKYLENRSCKLNLNYN